MIPLILNDPMLSTPLCGQTHIHEEHEPRQRLFVSDPGIDRRKRRNPAGLTRREDYPGGSHELLCTVFLEADLLGRLGLCW